MGKSDLGLQLTTRMEGRLEVNADSDQDRLVNAGLLEHAVEMRKHAASVPGCD
jgi:hypothetical protein